MTTSNFWDYESQISYNTRQAQDWATTAKQQAGEFMLSKNLASGGLTTEAQKPMSPANPWAVQLHVPDTVIDQTQPGTLPADTKKPASGLLGGLESLLKPVGRVLQAEQKYVATPLATALYTPFETVGNAVGLGLPDYKNLPGVVKSGLQVLADPLTYIGPGEITGVMKLTKLAPEVKLAAPALETLFSAPGSRRLMVDAIKETAKRAGVGLGAVAGAEAAKAVGLPPLIGGFAGAHLTGNVLRGSPVSRDWNAPEIAQPDFPTPQPLEVSGLNSGFKADNYNGSERDHIIRGDTTLSIKPLSHNTYELAMERGNDPNYLGRTPGGDVKNLMDVRDVINDLTTNNPEAKFIAHPTDDRRAAIYTKAGFRPITESDNVSTGYPIRQGGMTVNVTRDTEGFLVLDPEKFRQATLPTPAPQVSGGSGMSDALHTLLDNVAQAPTDFAAVKSIDEVLSFADYTRTTTQKLRSTMADYFSDSPEIVKKVADTLTRHNVRFKDTDITALINFHQARANLGPEYGATVSDELKAIRDNATASNTLATANINHRGSTASVVTDPELVQQARAVAGANPDLGLLTDDQFHLGDLIENRNLFNLTPQQNAIIDSLLAPMAAHREYESYFDINSPSFTPNGDFVHRQITGTQVPGSNGDIPSRPSDSMVESPTGPVVARSMNALQPFERPRTVASESAGYAAGNKYLPFNESQGARVAQGFRTVADTWLNAALDGVGKTVSELLPKDKVDTLNALSTTRGHIADLYKEVTRAKMARSRNAWIPPRWKPVGGPGSPLDNIIQDASIASQQGAAARRAAFTDIQGRLTQLSKTVDNQFHPLKEDLASMKSEIQLSRQTPLRGNTPIEYQGRYYPKDIGDQLNEINRVTNPTAFVKTINEVNDAVRPIMATLDLSFLGVQGLVAALSHPTNYLSAAQTLFSSGYADFEQAAKNDGTLGAFINAGGHWAARNDAAEFIFPSYFKNLPVVGSLSDSANALFTQFGNILRVNLFKAGWRTEMAGASTEAEALRAGLARNVNLITGFSTSNPGALEKTLQFAPRFFRSQLGLVADAVTKRDFSNAGAARALGTMMVSGVTMTTMINQMLGNTTKYDPADPNFMRIRFAGKDLSLFGPWDTLFRAVSKTVEDGDPKGGADYLLRTKASPVLSKMYDLLTGQMLNGQKLSWGSPQDIIESAGKMAATVGVPISVQSAVSENIVPAIEGKQSLATAAAGTGLSFLGVKATPLSPSETMVIKRDNVAQQAYNKPWSQLEPYQQDQLRKDNNLDLPSNTDLSRSFEFRRQIATTYQTQEQQLDDSLPIGKTWIDAYHNLQNQQVGAFAQWAAQNPDALAQLKSSTAKTPEGQALNNFYKLFDQADQENWTPDELSQAVSDFRDSQPQATNDYIDRNTGLHETDRVKQYKAAQKTLAPYWDFENQIWDRLKGRLGDVGNAASLQEYTDNLVGRLQQQGVPDRIIVQRVQTNPVISEINRATGVLRDRYRQAHPEADALLQKWYGYAPIGSGG